MKQVVSLTLIMILPLLAACGELPPPDPYNLKNSKDSLSRGHYWYSLGCYDEAESFFEESLNFARLSDNVPLMVRSLSSQGAALMAKNDLPGAAASLDQALEISLSLPDEQPDLDRVLANLGSLAYKSGRIESAAEFWLQAVQAARKKGENPAQYYCNLAHLYLEQRQDAKFDRVLAELEKSPTEKLATSILSDLKYLQGLSAQKKGEPDKALKLFEEALDWGRKTEDLEALAQAAEAAGLLLASQNRAREAAGHLDRAFYLWAALGRYPERDKAWQALASLHTSAGHPQSLAGYERARANPKSYLIAGTCP